MPVTFGGTPVAPTKKPVLGRQSYNEAIKKLTPHIAEARKNGRYGIQEIADYLNEKGIKAPTGRSFHLHHTKPNNRPVVEDAPNGLDPNCIRGSLGATV